MLTPSLLEKVHTLWDQLADMPPAEIDAALEIVFTFFGETIQADNAMWGGGVRLQREPDSNSDPTFGWRAHAMHPWKPDPDILNRIARFREAVSRGDASESGSLIRHSMRHAGQFRTHHLREPDFDFATFTRSHHYRIFYQEAGVQDRMCVCFPVNENTESHFYFDRLDPSACFTADEIDFAAFTLRGIKWFHRQLLLRHGVLAAGSAFTPTEWKVIPHLLTDLTEKEIASLLELTFDATHKHVRNIFRKLGVRGRAGLLALWHAG